MFAKRIFETEFSTALKEELESRGMSVRQLSALTGIPPTTLYKVLSGERDPRFSTVKRISGVFTPNYGKFIAVIAVKFLLDDVEGTRITCNGSEYRIKGYAAGSYEECLVAAVQARNDGASGIICAPILSSLVEKLVDIPVAIMKPESLTINSAAESLAKRL
ncbi:MAG TPA: helix-turn-helix domain-containing protein [Methanocorpusculum sp.]|nr:helix-turn-helix domain-containing protein [Candidatus Methanocorpusculum equi]MCQ2357504.1 helix-turn-helix domain-containing protein [Methanocorpusculum sp.]HJJ32972.1 helix-turn-helix domain-containing protein [Methanocorpusculum sp.]HJJ44181.1 helix-turn-helix domain-containing protein [Methanocorpusculum sp.]